MKSKLTYIVLFSVLGIASTAAAETTGLISASSLAYALPFSLFITSLVLMTFGLDYSRPRLSLVETFDRPVLNPAPEAFATKVTAQRPLRRRRSLARRARLMSHV
jgi:hypothetical protein